MDPRDDDIEFDFFDDEPATAESSGSPRMRFRGRGGPREPRRPLISPRATAPMLRLLALVAFVVFLVLVFGLLIQSCVSSSKREAYASYMEDVQTIAAQSRANGKRVVNVLTTAGLSVTQIQSRLRGIAEQERQNLQAAEALDPPGRLRDENAHLVEALGLRVSGVSGLADTFQKVANSTDDAADAKLLVAQANRLLASDVVWDDLFKALAVAQLQHDGVSGVNVPDSTFLADPDLITPDSMTLVLQRIRGPSGGASGGVRGTNIVSTKAVPGGQALLAGTLTTVTATTDLGFQVTVEDSGDSQEVGIDVTLTIERASNQGGPIVKTQQIDVINPGEQKTVTFTDLGQVPFATQTTVRVDVATVENESNRDNNSAQYPVIFSLP